MMEIFDREFVIDTGDHNIPLLRLQTAINDQNIPGTQSGIQHGITGNTDKKSGSRLPDQ